MTQEEKAHYYDEAIERARYWEKNPTVWSSDDICQKLFPELKESEDDEIRKSIIAIITNYVDNSNTFKPKMIAWLEKQCQKPQGKSAFEAAKEENVDNQNCVKPADKVKPKFNVGDWISGYYTNYKVLSVNNNWYVVEDVDGNKINILFENEKFHRLWTIRDAKDGDVLASNRSIFIFSQEYIAGKPEAHCGIMNGLFLVKSEGCWTNEKYYPATKEQRDTLMKAMVDAGYTFDFEKKELKKIEQKSADKSKIKPKFKTGDRVIGIVSGMQYFITKVCDDRYNTESGCIIMFCSQDNFELYERNPAEWSEDDENRFNNLCLLIDASNDNELTKNGFKNWLKSIKERYTWKPNDEQMKALNNIIVNGHMFYSRQERELMNLYNDLKNLIKK